MSDEIRVGPTPGQCDECGAPDDGYGLVEAHYARCSKAPKGKAAKAHPTLVDPSELPWLRDKGTKHSKRAPNDSEKGR